MWTISQGSFPLETQSDCGFLGLAFIDGLLCWKMWQRIPIVERIRVFEVWARSASGRIAVSDAGNDEWATVSEKVAEKCGKHPTKGYGVSIVNREWLCDEQMRVKNGLFSLCHKSDCSVTAATHENKPFGDTCYCREWR
jgi:hypothetical protein